MTTHREVGRPAPWPRTPGRTVARAGAAAGGLLFVALGAGKLFVPGVAAEAGRLGVPDAARQLVGAVEIAGGLLVLWPQTWVAGVGALAAVLATGAGAHLATGRPGMGVGFLVPVALVAAVSLLSWRRDRLAWRDRYAAVLARYAARGERR